MPTSTPVLLFVAFTLLLQLQVFDVTWHHPDVTQLLLATNADKK
jgi:hypothetical protein